MFKLDLFVSSFWKFEEKKCEHVCVTLFKNILIQLKKSLDLTFKKKKICQDLFIGRALNE